jgi:hypothetical protein
MLERQLNYEEAYSIAESGITDKWSDEQIVRGQLYQHRLFMSFERFHKALEHVLGRPVWTHEMAHMDRLRAEYEKKAMPPHMGRDFGPDPGRKAINSY